MEKRLEVCWWDGSTVGHLIHRGSHFFVYDEAWLRRGLDLSPLSLPFTDIAFNGAKGIDGLPGLIADCLPDAWGRKVARTQFAKNKWGEPTVMTLLAWRGTHGLGALRFRPPLEEKAAKELELISAASLARGARQIERDKPSSVLPQLARGGSAGGARPKALVLAYADGSLRVGEPDGLGQPGLLKFDHTATGEDARVEEAYAHMAREAGLRVVQTRLIEEAPGSARCHLFVTRFDLPDADGRFEPGEKLRRHFHSASGLLHRAPEEFDYLDLFRAAIRLQTDPAELRELARRMIFNVLASNHDDHGKNHAFQLDEKIGRWSLTPAYDLTYSSGLLQRGAQVAGEVWPKAATMEELGQQAGISRAEFREIFDQVRAAISRWIRIAKQVGVPEGRMREIRERLGRIRKEVG